MMLSKFTRLCCYFSEVQTIAGHKPPALTDTPSGRYAGALFASASKTNCLTDVKKDLIHLGEVLKVSPLFREILKNSAVRRSKQRQIFGCFANEAYNQITLNFIQAIIDAGRLSQLEKTIQIYINYCKILNKEEDIRVIAAVDLSESQKEKVISALRKNKPDTKFKVTYEVDPAILGGLQIFAGSQFLDCSLRSRIQRLKTQLSRIA